MERPLVSVICLCYNHERFVKEAIDSVLNQTYPNIELIVVDDCSTDRSVTVIKSITSQNPRIKFLSLKTNLGNCKAFNQGWKMATGQFVVDFSTDDVMLPERIEKQIDFFLKQGKQAGVVFTDAIYIDDKGAPFKNHFEYLLKKKLIDHIPSGDIFRDVLTTYFICSPTMMVRKEVMDSLGGYDESLAYEDFDFWMRASRDFHFTFLNERLTKVRKSSGSMSSAWYEPGDPQLHSTYLVCLKATNLCRDEADRNALRWRVLYEFKQAVFSGNNKESKLFAQLLRSSGKISFSFYVIRLASFIPLPWPWIRSSYYKLLYN